MRRPHNGAVGLKESGRLARKSREHAVHTEQRHVRFCRYRFPATDLNSKATLIKPASNVAFQFQQKLYNLTNIKSYNY
jgi:hypothetical protein